MSLPSKELMKLAFEGRLAHGGHPMLAWMVGNIHVRTDPAGNIKPDKQKSTEKIDGVVSTITALDRAIRDGGASADGSGTMSGDCRCCEIYAKTIDSKDCLTLCFFCL